MFGNHGLCGLPEEGAHEKSPKCLDGNLGDFGEFCKGLGLFFCFSSVVRKIAMARYQPRRLARLETERFTNRRAKRTQYCAFQRVDDVLLYDTEGAEEFSRFFAIPGLNHCDGSVDLRLL